MLMTTTIPKKETATVEFKLSLSGAVYVGVTDKGKTVCVGKGFTLNVA